MNAAKQRIMKNNNIITSVMVLLVMIYHNLMIPTNQWYAELNIPSITHKGWYPFYAAVISILNNTHVPILFIVSGYTFAYIMCYTEKYKNFDNMFIKKSKRLIVPFAFISVCYILPIYYITGYIDVSEIADAFSLGMFHLWYIRNLFVITLSAWITWRFTDKIWFKSIITITSILMMYTRISTTILFFYIGVYTCRYDIVERWRSRPATNITMITSLILITLHQTIVNALHKDNINIYYGSVLDILAGPIVFYLSHMALMKHGDTVSENKCIIFLKKHSYCMYLFHEPIIYLCVYFLKYKIDIFLLMAASFAISFSASALISIACHHFNITKFLIGETRRDPA